MWKRLTLAVVSAAMLGACARPMMPAEDSLAYHQQGLNATPLSAGACDEIGQYIPVANQAQRTREEASAAPTH